MKLVTSAQMRAIDHRAIHELGIPSLQLMENAGQGIAAWIREIFRDNVTGKRFAIFCGKGNNGGDGFVIARYLSQWGANPEVFRLGEREATKGDALVNLLKIESAGLKIHDLSGAGSIPELRSFDMIIDAIFGTGFQGEVDAKAANIIRMINASGVPVLAVDTPSGLNSDNGEKPENCIQAAYTASIGLPKVGHYFYPGRSYCGLTRVIDIGIPKEALAGSDLSLELTTPWQVQSLIPDREPTAHKGDAGKLFIVAGSEGLTGAATLAAQAAVRSGCGLVTVGCPKGLNDILEMKLTEAMTRPLPELSRRRCLSVRALGDILQAIRSADAACLGPGVGRNHETIELFRRLIVTVDKPAVLDADGLFAFTGKSELIKQCSADVVLTPHVGEFARLTGLAVAEIERDRIRTASDFAVTVGKTVLLKGAPTLISAPDGTTHVNPTGNPGMATGGSGDVLSGVIGSLLALGLSGCDSAICGAFIHGWAGDLAQRSIGTFGMSAMDIVEYLPKALKTLKN